MLAANAPFVDEVLAAHGPAMAAHGVVVVLGDNRGLTAAELATVTQEAAARGLPLLPVSLGATPLLASHCLVLIHHYLDQRVHCCEGAGAAGRVVTSRELGATREQAYSTYAAAAF